MKFSVKYDEQDRQGKAAFNEVASLRHEKKIKLIFSPFYKTSHKYYNNREVF
jgi:hypothetical protein